MNSTSNIICLTFDGISSFIVCKRWTCRLQLRGNNQHLEVRQQSEKHQELCQNQRGSQRRPAEDVSEGDRGVAEATSGSRQLQ